MCIHRSVICVSAGVGIFASMFAHIPHLFVHVCSYARLRLGLCVCAYVCVHVCACASVSEQSKSLRPALRRETRRLDARPNAFRRCLFNHNLGLHENANRKQAALPGKLDRGEAGGVRRGEEEGGRGKDGIK